MFARLTPTYWHDRWSDFTVAAPAPPKTIVTSPRATPTDIAAVDESVATASFIERTAWAATWAVQGVAIIATIQQTIAIISGLMTGIEQCQRGECERTSIATDVLWMLIWISIFFAIGRARRRLERLIRQRTHASAHRVRGAHPRVIVVDELPATDRWLLARAEHLLRAYPTRVTAQLWTMACRADAATRTETTVSSELEDANRQDLAVIEAAYEARQPLALPVVGVARVGNPPDPSAIFALLPVRTQESV